MNIKIVSRWDSSKVLYDGNFSSIRLCLQAAVKSDADLGDANLRGADLGGADLRGANLGGANLRGANFDIDPATDEQAVKALDVVAEIILGDPTRLYMEHWHGGYEWKDRTCAEEATCGTTHCLAGWLQVCSTDKRIKDLAPNVAGFLCAPIAASQFYKTNDEVLTWLKNREYAK